MAAQDDIVAAIQAEAIAVRLTLQMYASDIKPNLASALEKSMKHIGELANNLSSKET
jgi:hypothetical protein